MITMQRFALAAFFLLVCGASLSADEYKDSSGFSLTYPNDWIAVNNDIITRNEHLLPPEVRKLVASGKINLNSMAVMIIRKVEGEQFAENLNVVVQAQQIPVNDKSVQELSGAVKQQYASMGVKLNNYQARVGKVAGRDAIVSDYEATVPGAPETLRQRQVMMPGGGKTFIITCTGTPATFNTYEPVFEKMLTDFQCPTVAATGFNWNQILMSGIVGGVIGAAVGLVGWAKKKFGSKPAA